jgi:hypothetical protein
MHRFMGDIRCGTRKLDKQRACRQALWYGSSVIVIPNEGAYADRSLLDHQYVCSATRTGKDVPGQSVGHVDIQLLLLLCPYGSSCPDCNDGFELPRSQPAINDA